MVFINRILLKLIVGINFHNLQTNNNNHWLGIDRSETIIRLFNICSLCYNTIVAMRNERTLWEWFNREPEACSVLSADRLALYFLTFCFLRNLFVLLEKILFTIDVAFFYNNSNTGNKSADSDVIDY